MNSLVVADSNYDYSMLLLMMIMMMLSILYPVLENNFHLNFVYLVTKSKRHLSLLFSKFLMYLLMKTTTKTMMMMMKQVFLKFHSILSVKCFLLY